MPRPRKMLVLAVEGCQSLDVLGPVEVFHHVSIEVPNAYQVSIVGPSTTEVVTTDSGTRLGVAPLPEPPPRHDTLLIAGGPGPRAAVTDQAIVDWVLRASQRARRTVSVCTGAY
ncbi:MAG TPA: DJ-1/PfpI family protein, partial [Chloroflexota bacterium]|nr:DJ-1/PfpI family protein [Chloroflexota bacterium]